MKAKLLLVAIITFCILNPNMQVEALIGGTGGQFGGGSGGLGGLTNQLADCGDVKNSESYKIELVYKPQNGKLEYIASVVVWFGSYNTYRPAVEEYAKLNTSHKKVVTSGPLVDLVKLLNRGTSVETLENNHWLDGHLPVEKWMKYMGVSATQLNKKHDKNPGRLNSYGYRLLIQKITYFCTSSNIYAMPRKELANTNINTANGEGDFQGAGTPASSQNDIRTHRDDIGIRDGDNYNPNRASFKDWYCGMGYNIIWFPNKYAQSYDYRPDSLCLDCDSTNSTWSHIYTDMANWDAIRDSLISENKTINSYFKSKTIGGKTFACREEIKVKYPDETNKVLVETGRYFTVGLPQKWRMTIPNFAPIKVERVKECHAYNQNDDDVTASTSAGEWANFWKQDAFFKSKDTGTIKINYKEENGSKKYDGDYKVDTYNQKVTGETTNKLTVTKSYKLEGDTFRYVRMDNNLSVSSIPNVAYVDLGTANFPISTKNKSNNESRKAATVTLKYTMPKDSRLTKSIGKNNYFGEDNVASEDIYKKAKEAGAVKNNYVVQGSLTSGQYNDLLKSSCIIEYCDNNGKNCRNGFNSCMTNKAKTGKNQKNCADGKGYACDINFKGECGKKGGKYYIDGVEVTKEEYIANGCYCTIKDGEYYLDQEKVPKEKWEKECPPCITNCPDPNTPPSCRYDKTNNKYYINNVEVTQEDYLKTCPCKVVNNKYYINDNEVTKAEYDAACPPDGPECPNGDPCCLGYCPPCTSEWCENVIYRTIDLNQPFPGYNAENRGTGSNWCTYNVLQSKLICDSYKGSLNTTVDNVVFKNRRVNTNPEQEYGLEPIYEVKLDAGKIEDIRRYNTKHKYSDFTLKCSKNSAGITVCKMDKNISNILQMSGVCTKSTVGDFYTCDE